jgi:hypothetical protein
MRLLAATLALLALPAAAGGYALPVGGVQLGGGGFSTDQLLDRQIAIKVGSDGRSLRIAGVAGARCGDKAMVRTFAGKARLGDDASFAVTLATRAPVDTFYFRGSGKARIDGRFDGDRATGTIALVGARVKAGGTKIACNDDAGTFETRDPRGAHGRGTATAGTPLYGLTAQRHDGVRQPVLARVSDTGRLVVSSPLYLSHCRYAYKQAFHDTPAMAVSAQGGFAGVHRYSTRYRTSRVKYRVRTGGHFTAEHGILGRIRMDVTAIYKRRASVRCPTAVDTTFAAVI